LELLLDEGALLVLDDGLSPLELPHVSHRRRGSFWIVNIDVRLAV
jgi:hypothetical protein